jgi:phospholipase C
MPNRIEHLIVLMMENRSFDHMLGFLPHPSSDFDGLKGTKCCPDNDGRPVLVAKTARYTIPSPDHSHAGVMQQLMGPDQSIPYKVTNAGFVQNYEGQGTGNGHKIMRCFDPEMVPVLSTLAMEFAVCTRWFCSVPGETWPNREFAHSGTSRGRADVVTTAFHSEAKTIFEQLDDVGATWRIYHDDIPHTWAYPALWDTRQKRARFGPIRRLHEDIANDSLPSYAFVEPDYGLIGKGNSQHPGQAHTLPEFVAGKRLIHSIYDSLRRHPAVFEKVVLLITYDEHGGFYDHVPPPTTVNPDGRVWKGTFAFDLLGVRVPAVIVSPWIKRGKVDSTVYDHTSIIQTIRSLFAPGQPALTERDAQAQSFSHLFQTSTEPRRGNELPVTKPLTETDAAALEARLEEERVLTFDTIVAADDFIHAMDTLSASVGTQLAIEAKEKTMSDKGRMP